MSAPSSGSPSDAVAASTRAPLGQAAAQELGAEQIGAAIAAEPTQRLKKGYLTLLIVAYCALYVAWIAPIGFSLAIRVGQLDPSGKNSLLALALGIPGIAVLVTGPLVGVLSDRTRLKFGPRRTWMLIGSVAGLLGSIVVGLAGAVPLLIAAWTVAYIGYTAVGGMVLTHLGDRLPEQQRGRVAGFSGAVTQLAPVVGIVIAGGFISTPSLMFIIPAIVAFVGIGVFLIVMKDRPAVTAASPLGIPALLQGFYFNPRQHSNFAWVWLSRLLIFLALSFSSIYTVYLLAARLGLPSATIAGLVATTGLGGVLLGIVGAIVGGYLSDKLQRRRTFLGVGAVLIAGGLVITATTVSVPQYFVGSFLTVLGIGIYGAVDQAIILDVLPQEEGQNGRFLGIINLANQLAQAAGPFLAGLIVAIGAGEYAWVYIVAAVLAIIGGGAIVPVRIARTKRDVTDPVAA